MIWKRLHYVQLIRKVNHIFPTIAPSKYYKFPCSGNFLLILRGFFAWLYLLYRLRIWVYKVLHVVKKHPKDRKRNEYEITIFPLLGMLLFWAITLLKKVDLFNSPHHVLLEYSIFYIFTMTFELNWKII